MRSGCLSFESYRGIEAVMRVALDMNVLIVGPCPLTVYLSHKQGGLPNLRSWYLNPRGALDRCASPSCSLSSFLLCACRRFWTPTNLKHMA